MKISTLSSLSLALAALAVPGLAFAATGTMHDPHKQVVTIQIQDGGKTAASVKRMHKAAGQYDLQLDIAKKPSGDSWSNVSVTVTDPKTNRTVINEEAAGGPLFYVRLPAGVYRVGLSDRNHHQVVINNVHVTPGQAKALTMKLTT